MGQLTRIASLSELPPEGEAREFFSGQSSVCIVNTNNNFVAMRNVCPHKGAPLSEGSVEDGKLVCAWHGWEFNLADGQCINRPGACVTLFELAIHGNDVFLKL
jgi:nitrite reductase (NADH) small subunit